MEDNSKITIKPIYIIFAVFEALFLFFVIITIQNLTSKDNQYGEATSINNLSSIHGLPSNTSEKITAMLYNMISSNNKDLSSLPNSNAVIRENSLTENYDEKSTLHHGDFIVDIAELKQSYQVQYSWYDKKQQNTTDSYEVLVTCLPEDKLIYEPFNCKDIVSEENQGVVAYFPYYVADEKKNTLYYARVNADNIYVIDAVAFSCNKSTTEAYHQKLREYFNTIPEDYLKKYTINYSSICYSE